MKKETGVDISLERALAVIRECLETGSIICEVNSNDIIIDNEEDMIENK